jgi:hypothetical protein
VTFDGKQVLKPNKMTNYQQAKEALKRSAIWVKKTFPNDLPMIRQSINDHADSLCRSFQLTDRQIDMLANYACKLHP